MCFINVYLTGNYKDAHNLLQHMYKELSSHEIVIPLEMEHNLQLLHSYVVVRMHIRRGQHLNAARLLIRVADSISKFPSRKSSCFNLFAFVLCMYQFGMIIHRCGANSHVNGYRMRPSGIEERSVPIRGHFDET